MVGISAPYEAPVSPEIHVRTDHDSGDAVVDRIMGKSMLAGVIGAGSQ